MNSILGLWTAVSPAGLDISWNVTADSLVTRGRNELVARFMRSAATHLLFIDADIGFAIEQVLEMLRFDQPCVAGVYPLKAHPPTGVGKKLSPGEQRGRFSTAEFAGCGFMLLRREVIERMIAGYPETRYTKQHVGGMEAAEHYALFDCLIVDGEYIPEDFGFCHRWRAIGGTIWLDREGRLTHTGAHTFEMPKIPR